MSYPLLYVSNDGDATIDSTFYVDVDGSTKTSSYSLTNIGASIGKLTNPATKLDVFGNATSGGLLNVYNDKDITPDSTFYVNELAYAAIGHDAPTQRLDVKGNIQTRGNNLTYNPTTDTANVSQTITAAVTIQGYITSTSVAPVTVTLPLLSAITTALTGTPTKGTRIPFIIDNSAGANVVTLAVNTGITMPTAVITGGNTLTMAVATIGKFEIVYVSTSTAYLYRIY